MSELVTTSNTLDWTEESAEYISNHLGEPDVLLKRRLEAVKRLTTTPWQTALDETWRRTDPRLIGRRQFKLFNPKMDADGFESPVGETPLFEQNEHPSSYLKLINGRVIRFDPQPVVEEKGIIFGDLQTILSSHENEQINRLALDVADDTDSPAVTLSNLAFYMSGSALRVPAGVELPVPFVVEQAVNTPNAAFFPLNLIHIGEGSQATVLLDVTAISNEFSWFSGMTRIKLEPGARLNLIAINKSNHLTRFYDHLQAEIGRDAEFNLYWADLTEGWSVMRREVVHSEPGSNSNLKGVFVGAGNAHYDLRSQQQHQAPSTTSNLLYKSALFGRSKSVFQGIVNVGKEAVGTNAYQLNRNLLLDSEVRSDSIPKLEIEVDEVKCSHGASSGKLDKEALFYLNSRGIPMNEAKRLLVESFLQEVVLKLSNKELADHWRTTVLKSLSQALNVPVAEQLIMNNGHG